MLVVIGLIIIMGSVGYMDTNPEADILVQAAIASIGGALMYLGGLRYERY